MALPKVIPAVADLTQDIAGPVPMQLVRAWFNSGRSVEEAGTLLSGFEVEGTVVSTDTSGLSEMTEEKDLLEVIALISKSKEIVYALGVEIGGTAIGMWVADNSEMFYPGTVAADTVVASMAEAQCRINADAPIRIGMGIHRGAFYHIGGALYGRDADLVETLAEACAGPGELLLTQTVAAHCSRPDLTFTARPDLAFAYPSGVFALGPGPRMPDLAGRDRGYPHPFPSDFFLDLSRLSEAAQPLLAKETIYAKYLRERVVVFLALEHPLVENLAALVDDLVAKTLMDAIIGRMATAQDHVAGLGGGVAILTFATPSEALAFARDIRETFVANDLPVRTGIDQGPVLFFPNPRGPSGIAGDPVNIASKISEDVGIAGKIHLTTRVADQIAGINRADPFQTTVSHLQLSGFTL